MRAPPSTSFLLIIFVVLTVAMIAVCGWTVFLWDIDRLFFRLESRIDTQLGEAAPRADEPDSSLLGRARDLVGNAVGSVRAKSIELIEKAYWDDINAGGVLSFPQPDIAAAIRAHRQAPPRPARTAGGLRGNRRPAGKPLRVHPVARDLQICGARGQSPPLPPPYRPLPRATGRAVYPYIPLLLPQHPGLVARMFVAVYVISSLFRVARFVFRRWRALLAR